MTEKVLKDAIKNVLLQHRVEQLEHDKWQLQQQVRLLYGELKELREKNPEPCDSGSSGPEEDSGG